MVVDSTTADPVPGCCAASPPTTSTPSCPASPARPCREGRGDAVGEHGHGPGLSDGARDARREAGARRDEHDARVGAELPGAERERRGEAARELVAARVERGRGDQDRVHRAELAVERDGIGSRRREVEQRAAAVQRPGEADGADLGMLHERHAGLAALDVPEDTCGRTRAGEGVGDDLGRAAGEPGVRRVPLDDDGASGREGRGGVAARDREREREVRRAEHRDGTERSQHPPQVGSRRGGRRVRVVDRRLEVGALDDGLGEEAQLGGRARELAREARRAEVRLLVGERDELVGGARRARRRPR